MHLSPVSNTVQLNSKCSLCVGSHGTTFQDPELSMKKNCNARLAIAFAAAALPVQGCMGITAESANTNMQCTSVSTTSMSSRKPRPTTLSFAPTLKRDSQGRTISFKDAILNMSEIPTDSNSNTDLNTTTDLFTWLTKAGFKHVALDFDQTLIEEHTRGYPLTVKAISELRIRPQFQLLIERIGRERTSDETIPPLDYSITSFAQAVSKCGDSLSGEDLMCEVLKNAAGCVNPRNFYCFNPQNQEVLKIPNARRFADLMATECDVKERDRPTNDKLVHLWMLLKDNPELKPRDVVLIDDSLSNISAAVAAKIAGIHVEVQPDGVYNLRLYLPKD